MSFLDAALKLAEKGFHVFPLCENSKEPLIPDFPKRATRETSQIVQWWTDPVLKTQKPYNVGISTSSYNCGTQALLVVDIDPKKGGSDSLFELEIQGCQFPTTFSQTTPSGGSHLLYTVGKAVKQGADVLARGLDVRSRGGYIVGAGSVLDGKKYQLHDRSLCAAPEWLILKCGEPHEKEEKVHEASAIDSERAKRRAIFYLHHEAPIAVEGQAGDQTTFAVAARLKDLGCGRSDAHALLLSDWNERCSPPWDIEELKTKVENAYAYGKNQQGVLAPEKVFSAVQESKKAHPFEEINREFSFVLAGGGHHILWETKDANGKEKLEHLTESAFHKKFASHEMSVGNRHFPTTELWMKAKNRRSYDGICFKPAQQAPANWYNLWRKFSVEAVEGKASHAALDAFLEHTEVNVCQGDKKLTRWLLGYFAHLIQKPWEKPQTALVFQGGKGVGKNALIDRVGYLLGNHYLSTSDDRYLLGNFNGHLENCLLFTLDEAFWSGDKRAEGRLKVLITGRHHNIEHKGKEVYTVDNCTRVVILGNEDWLVPASHDERRYAVFQVGDSRKQDRRFFADMRIGMEERGGYSHLLRYLQDFDLGGIDLDEAPVTQGLLAQKEATLEPFQQWWLSCLQEGEIVGMEFSNGGEWPNGEVSKERFRDAYYAYAKGRGIKGRLQDSRGIGRYLSKLAPGTTSNRKRDASGGEAIPVYQLPDLEKCRENWERFIGHPIQW